MRSAFRNVHGSRVGTWSVGKCGVHGVLGADIWRNRRSLPILECLFDEIRSFRMMKISDQGADRFEPE